MEKTRQTIRKYSIEKTNDFRIEKEFFYSV